MNIDEFLFQVYKDKPIVSRRKFNDMVARDYKTLPSTECYKKIINYQIDKYGEFIHSGYELAYVDNKRTMSSIKKKLRIADQLQQYKTKQLEKRSEKNG